MSAAEHDRLLALTSHLPHVLAAVSASCVTSEELDYTGTGFRDTSRVAAGSASLWRHILAGNRDQIIEAIRMAESVLADFRQALSQKDDQQVEHLLETAAERRRQLADD
jgi:prephenate dehydrogenase